MIESSGSPGFKLRRPFSSFFETIVGVLLRPDRFFARFDPRELRDTTGPVVFAVICTIVSSLLAVLTRPFNPLPLPGKENLLGQEGLSFGVGLVATLLFFVVIALILLFVGTLVQHLLTLPFIRYGEGVRATLMVIAYGVNTISLLSWIPVAGYLAIIYGVYVSTVGLREVHSTTTVRALIPALIFLALQIFLAGPDLPPIRF